MALQDLRLVGGFVRCAKNSPWLMIALGLHVLLATGMSVAYVRHERRRAGPASTEIVVAALRPAPPRALLPEEQPERQKIPEQREMELVSFDEQPAFVPTEEPPAEIDWHDPVGDPTGTDEESSSTGGASIGVGIGGRHGTGTPSSFLRGRLGSKNGGIPGRPHAGEATFVTEEAVLEGLLWLMRHQEADGSWSASKLHTHCSTRTPCIPPDPALDSSFDVGMTALALLAFLGQGITVGSRVMLVDEAMGTPPRSGGEVVKKGILWLLAHQKPDGSFSDSRPFELPENDTLPTMALCEAYGLSPGNKRLRQPAQRALDFLVAAQKRNDAGEPWGWGRGSQRDLEEQRARGELADAAFAEKQGSVDLSITCWVVMALRSAQSCGFRVAAESVAGALAYAVDATEAGSLGTEEPIAPPLAPEEQFAYHAARREALGMLIRAFAGGDIAEPFLEDAARALAADVPRVTKDQLSVDFYYWYFATLALEQYDGPDSPRDVQNQHVQNQHVENQHVENQHSEAPHRKGERWRGQYWEPWNESLVDALLPLQERATRADVCARGGWLQAARGNRRGRALYNTALNVLTLEVYYRFENVFGSSAREAESIRDR